MKRLLIITTLLLAVAFLSLSCGKGGSSKPYSATQGATVTAPGDATYNSNGNAFGVNYPVHVYGKDGNLQNDVLLKAWIFVVTTASNYAVITSAKDLVGDTSDFEDWDDDGLPLYMTDENGRADVLILVPFGFAGEMDLSFDIGVAQVDSKLTIVPAGASCFDGTDNNGDTNIDAADPLCTNPFSTAETALSSKETGFSQ